jgi:hypothetical protein
LMVLNCSQSVFQEFFNLFSSNFTPSFQIFEKGKKYVFGALCPIIPPCIKIHP